MKSKMMKPFASALPVALLCAATAVSAQNAAPELSFDSAANVLTLPADVYLGEVGGVATNSRGDIFVYTRTGHPTLSLGTARPFAHNGSRLFQFDRSGKFTREIGQGLYGFLFAAQVRVDPQDNIWVVDEMSAMVMKFDPQGRVAFLLGRKAEAVQNPPRAGGDCRMYFCTRHDSISPSTISFGLRQSIMCTTWNPGATLPGLPNFPRTVPSSSVL